MLQPQLSWPRSALCRWRSRLLSCRAGGRPGKLLPEGPNGGHVDLDHLRTGRGDGAVEALPRIRDPNDALVRSPTQLANQPKSGVKISGIHPPAVILRVLDVADDAVAAVIHHDVDDIGGGFHGSRQFADHQLRAAVAKERDGLCRNTRRRPRRCPSQCPGRCRRRAHERRDAVRRDGRSDCRTCCWRPSHRGPTGGRRARRGG